MVIATGLFAKWAGLWSLGKSPWLWRILVQRVRQWLSEPRHCGVEEFVVGSTVNFLENRIKSLRNFTFQESHSLRS